MEFSYVEHLSDDNRPTMWFKRLTSRVAPDDARLLQLYTTTGDPEHVGDLYDRYVPLVYGVCLKYLRDEEASKDAVVQIFEKLLVTLRNTEVQHFRSWLHTVVKNHCLMHLRQQDRHRHTDLLVLEDVVDEATEEVVVDRWPLIEQGLKTLSDEQQRCVRLFFLEQKSYQEVAALTGYEIKKVKSHLQNGKRNLKIFVEKNNE